LRTGIAAIREAQRTANADDTGPMGFRAAFRRVAGRGAADAFNRAARADERAERAKQDIAALKDALKAERRTFIEGQSKDATALKHRHDTEDRQMGRAVDAKRAFDRTAEVEGRRQETRGITRDGIGRRSGPSPTQM
jgi:hypothetical protein